MIPLKAFLEHCGVGPTEHYRALATNSTDDWKDGMASLTINGAKANMAQMGAAKLFHKIARCLIKLDLWPEDIAAAATAAASAPPPAAPPASSGTRLLNVPTIQIGRHLDQKYEEEITYMPDVELQACRAHYYTIMEAWPTPQVNCTSEQLACIDYSIKKAVRAPYADFSVFGRHGARRARKMSMTGLLPQPGGTWKTVEVLGPGSLELWFESYDVLCTCLMMLNVVRRPRLAAYRAHIESLAHQFGPQAWPLLYQADVRCRQEWMEQLRFQLITAHLNAMTMGRPSTFRQDKPWDSVWEAAVLGEEANRFWKREFEQDASALIRPGSGIASRLEGDAPCGNASYALRAPDASALPPQIADRKRPALAIMDHQAGGKGAKGKGKKGNQDESCRNFNSGRCTNKSCRYKHTCSSCGAKDHGAANCHPDGGGKKSKKDKGKKGKKY